MQIFLYFCTMISEKLTYSEIFGAQELFQSAKKVLILTHLSPDGDAIGSAAGLAGWLQKRYANATVQVVVPNEFPDFLHWVPGAEKVVQYEQNESAVKALFEEADLIVCTDFGEPKRIGAMGDLLVQATCPRLVIDHHVLSPDSHFMNPRETDLVISYPEASSTCELVYRLIRQSGDLPSLEVATCLYTGLMTDTGNFQFSCKDPEVFEIQAELIRAGVDKTVVYDNVFNQYTADRMRLMGYCLYRKMEILEGNVALIYLSRKELYSFNFQPGDAEGIVNLPLQIGPVKYSCFMREDKDKIKISFRSQGNRPVNEFSHRYFNGGGHINAAGGEYLGPLAEAVARFKSHYREMLQ